MGYEVNKKISAYNHNKMTSRDVKYIVLHWVGAVSTAKNNVDYFAGGDRQASAHYFVDKSSIWQSVEEKDVAWHCGTSGTYKHQICRNANSIGIEMCLESDWTIAEETLKRTIWLVQELVTKHGIPYENIIRHYDVTGKLCPAPYVDDSKWNVLKERITTQVVAATAQAATQPTATTPTPEAPAWQTAAFENACKRGIIQTPAYWENLTRTLTVGEAFSLMEAYYASIMKQVEANHLQTLAQIETRLD